MAGVDAGNHEILNHINVIRVSRGLWSYGDPAKYLAEKLELNNIKTGFTVFGGNGVQSTLNLSCIEIQNGKFEVIAITGAECGYTQAQARRAGQPLRWRELPGTPDWTLPTAHGFRHLLEAERGIGSASQLYAIIENAIRYERGATIAEQQEYISKLWSRFNDVARDNPHAWIRGDVSALATRTESSHNRRIAFPNPKRMNANNNVDQGAALILCSVATAKRLQIPECT